MQQRLTSIYLHQVYGLRYLKSIAVASPARRDVAIGALSSESEADGVHETKSEANGSLDSGMSVQDLSPFEIITGSDRVFRGVTRSIPDRASVVSEQSALPQKTDYANEGSGEEEGAKDMILTCPITGETFDFSSVKQVYIA
jgi:hypothetical protein